VTGVPRAIDGRSPAAAPGRSSGTPSLPGRWLRRRRRGHRERAERSSAAVWRPSLPT
jgi:hypothetical protein